MKDVNDTLRELAVVLPSPPSKAGIYAPAIEFGKNLLYCSGCGPALSDGTTVTGTLGKDISIEQGQKAAYNCVLNLLANLQQQLGDLNRVKKFVKVLAFVQSTDDFGEQPRVVNGGSQLLLEVFGPERGLPARSAIGTNALPGNIACEIECLVEFE